MPTAVPSASAIAVAVDADEQAQPQPVEDGGQHVAALVVGAEQVELAVEAARARRQHVVHDRQLAEIVGVLRSHPRREQRETDQDRHHRERRERGPALRELAPRRAQARLRRRHCRAGEQGHGQASRRSRTRGSSSV